MICPLQRGISGFTQQNLRSRVSSVTFENIDDSDSLTYESATHFSYDIGGNVSSLIQENLLPHFIDAGFPDLIKRIDYDYDLISGKINYVYYQRDSIDQFIHHYKYDDDNRLTEVSTSRDGMLRTNEKFGYYSKGNCFQKIISLQLLAELSSF